MDHEPSELSRERAVSSEPCSTRAYPYNQDDSSSRKRQRVSRGDSRSRSAETNGESGSAPPSTPPRDNESTRRELDIAPPRTPTRTLSDLPVPEPTSSRVTINLRTQRTLEDAPSSPVSPSTPSKMVNGGDDTGTRVSVESESDALSTVPPIGTPSSSPSSPTRSPTVELVSISEDDAEYEEISPAVLEGDLVTRDPMPDFPYLENQTSVEAVRKISRFFSHDDVNDDVVFCKLRDWMKKMLSYADGSRKLYEHFVSNREFWTTFPEIFWGLNARSRFFGNFLQRSQQGRRVLSELFHLLAMLTGRFVAMDIMTLTYHKQRAGTEQDPDLGSYRILEILSWLLTRKEEQQHIGRNLEAHYSWVWENEVHKMSLRFQEEGGAIPRLTRLVRGQLPLLGRQPKIIESLMETSRIVGKVVMDEASLLENSPLRPFIDAALQHISEGFDYFKVMSSGLENIIDKHVTCLTPDIALVHITNLTDIFQKALTFEDSSTRLLIDKRLKLEPQISRKAMPMVLAYEWRFTILKSLITSTQMQLRVIGATTMCADLLTLYNQSKNTEPSQNPTLVFLANFVLHHKLIDYLVSIGSHPEIINESHNILGFLIVTKTYPSELTDRIWNTVTTSQDPRVVEAILKMIQQCLNLHDYSAVLYLCQKANGLPLASFNPAMREFCARVFQQLIEKAKPLSLPFLDAPPFTLCVRIIRESSVITPQVPNGYPDIQNFAATKFLELLQSGIDVKTRQNIYAGCIEDMSSNAPTAPGSICVLHALIQQNKSDLNSLTNDHGLTRLVVEEIEQRQNHIQSSLLQNSPINLARRKLLYMILDLQADTVTPDLGQRLWNQIVGIESANEVERAHSWGILNKINKTHPGNAYITTCFKEHLPKLPPQCFTEGALEFCRSAVTSWLASAKENHTGGEFCFDSPGLEQLWRMILCAPPFTIDAKAISILVEVYLESQLIRSLSRADAKRIHLALVKRCLEQLATAASQLKAYSNGISNGDDDGMVIVPSESQFNEQEQIFARSLAVLREFLKAYQTKPHFTAVKPRPFVARKPSVAQGEPLTVKYQSFDGNVSTEVKELHLGKLNTTAALLASLEQATGFQNYSIYVAGQPFTPDEAALSKSLDDLRLTSLVLVRRQDGSIIPSNGSEASLETEIMKHFEELWGYLGMQEKVAREIYTFLIKFPVYERLLQDFDSQETVYTDIFPHGQPFRCLYAIHALREYIAGESKRGGVNETSLSRAISLLVAAICDEEILAGCATTPLNESLAIHLIDCLIQFLKEPIVPSNVAPHLSATLLQRLLSILDTARSCASTEGSVKLTCSAFEALLECSLHKPPLWVSFASHLESSSLLGDLVLRDSRPVVRKHVAKQIVSKCTFSPSMAQVSTSDFIVQFWPMVESLVSKATRYPRQCEEAFLLAHTLLKRLAETSLDFLDLEAFVKSWGALLIQHKCIEVIGQPESLDPVVQGLINLLYCAASFGKASKKTLACSKIGYELFTRHLFPETHLSIPYDQDRAFTPSIPLLHPFTRHTMSETIFLLVKDDPIWYEKTLQCLLDLVPYDGTLEDSPYSYELIFFLDRAKHIRSPTGYVGLKNLSNTCYLNSLFTQLFMNIPFRNFMIHAQNADEGASQRLLHETQLLFSNMQNSLVRYVDPQNLAASIRTYEETPIDVHIQMDVDEFYNLLFDRWEGQILSPEAKKAFRAFYGGQLVQQVKSKECPHISERLEQFSAIQCDIKGKTCLQESLQAYVDGEVMEGDNKYKCSTCDRHVDAVKRACLKDIPDNLIFHLKRFDFNLRTLQRSKINDHFSFPSKIDMRPYKVEYLMDNPEDVSEDVFELVGVLVHAGTAESGHYYSYIRERPSTSEKETWLEFNDDLVTSWEPNSMEHATFGGFDYRPDGTPYEKSYSAYMLFYQRSSVLASQQQSLVASKTSSPVRLPVPAEISNQIALENELLMRKYCIYDPSHLQLVTRMLLHVRKLNGGQCSEQHLLERKALFMALNHLDQVVTRTKDLPDFPNFMMLIKQACFSCAECTRDYLEWYCTHPDTLRHMLLRNPDAMVRNEIATSILSALQKVKSDLPYAYGLSGDDGSTGVDDIENDDPHIIQKIVVGLVKIWDIFHINCRAWPEYFGLLASIAGLGNHEAVLLLDAAYLRKVLEVICADTNLALTPQLSRMLNIVSKRFHTKPVNFEAVITLLWRLMNACDRSSEPVHDNEMRFDLLMGEEGRVPLTITERDIFCQRWTRSNVLILVEKLLLINQNPIHTHEIITTLMSWDDDELDPCIYSAINAGIKRVSATSLAGPFLKAAIVYCENTDSNRAPHVLDQIMKCAKDVDHTEGREFLRFFKEIARVSPSDASNLHPDYLLNQMLRNVGMWAPPLLTYYEAPVRLETEDFLTDLIISHGPDADFGPSSEADEKSSIITEAGQKLGVACLKYLDDTFIRARQQAVRSSLVSISNVIQSCQPFFDEDQGDQLSHQFFDLRSTVPNNLKRLEVEEVDEEVSDWVGSEEDYDSEPMGSIAELGNPPHDDLNDVDV